MATKRPLRLLSIAHSYCVALNRRLAHEMQRAGEGEWEITAVAPSFMHGDLRPIPLEPFPGEAARLEPVPTYLSRRIHLMFYGPRLRALLRERPWDLVHCWEEPYVVAGAQVAAWTPREVPFVFWTAQNLVKRYPPPFSWMERYCLDRCAGWLACGESIVEALAEKGYGEKPHLLAPLGIDTEVFRPDPQAGERTRRELGWPEPGPPVVGYLGRFVEDKGVDLLMRVLDGLETPWRALFVGGGPLEDELRRWAARQEERVRIVTGVPHASVPAYLNAMDLICGPSRTMPRWREQLGRMITEGFACGVPVVGSDSGEIPHVIGDAGVLLPDGDEAAWRRGLAELLESPARRRELGARGRERAQSVYAWPIIARRHLAFFRELLEVRPAAGRAA